MSELKRIVERSGGIIETFQVDETGSKQGVSVRTFENGKPWLISYYQNGFLHGEFIELHEDGYIREHSMYSNGKQCGEMVLKRDDRVVRHEIWYSAELVHTFMYLGSIFCEPTEETKFEMTLKYGTKWLPKRTYEELSAEFEQS